MLGWIFIYFLDFPGKSSQTSLVRINCRGLIAPTPARHTTTQHTRPLLAPLALAPTDQGPVAIYYYAIMSWGAINKMKMLFDIVLNNSIQPFPSQKLELKVIYSVAFSFI